MKNLTEAQKVVIALKIAKDLNLNHYTSDVFARTADGFGCDSTDPRACQWCAIGATRAAVEYVGTGYDRVREILFVAGRETDEFVHVDEINDRCPELLPALWDRAIALAESEAL